MPTKQEVDDVLSRLYGDPERFRAMLTNVDSLMQKVCSYAEWKAKKARCEPWSIISEITGHGSGVSSAIYDLYRKKE